MNKQISKASRLRLIRQARKNIERLESRLVTCRLEEHDAVMKALREERTTLQLLAAVAS